MSAGNMNFKQWKLGCIVAVILSLLVAGAGLTAGMKWQGFIAVFCTACLTHLGSFFTQHPIETISFDTTVITKDTVSHTESTIKTPSETQPKTNETNPK